jgi:hypothetical protein
LLADLDHACLAAVFEELRPSPRLLSVDNMLERGHVRKAGVHIEHDNADTTVHTQLL